MSTLATTNAPASAAIERLHEATSGYSQINREAGVIEGVRILSEQSKNGRMYLREAMAAGARLYEGAKVFIDHVDPKQTKRRATRERWGKLVNVRMQDDALIGDLHYLKTHSETEPILESVERFEDAGLSHDTDGRVEDRGGVKAVTEIVKVYSVDFVQHPATNTNLFEDVEVPADTKPEPKRASVLSVLREHVEDKLAARLLANIADMDAPITELVEMVIPDDDNDCVRSALRAAMDSIIYSGDDPEKMLARLAMLVEANRPSMREGSCMTEGDMKKMQEELAAVKASEARLQEELGVLRAAEAQAKTRQECTRLLEGAKREVTDVRLEALAALPAEKRGSLVESWPAQKERPAASPGRIQEAISGSANEVPASFDEFKKRLAVR